MILSPLQDRALAAIRRWLDDPSGPQVLYLAGVAGSGKSTCVEQFVAGVAGRVCYCAPTGKAALVMRSKGCPNARTIHSLIYKQAGEAPTREQVEARLREAHQAHENAKPGTWRDAIASNIARLEAELEDVKKSRRRGGPRFRLNPLSDVVGSALVVCDEASMVDEPVGRDLCSFGVKILAIGDPAQLPPVFGAGHFTSRAPDFMLDEVHRQAADSPVLWAATRVRLGDDVPYGVHGDGALVVVRRGDAENERRAMEADQILVGRNATRRATNRKMRALLGFAATSPWPVPADRLVCLRNDHEAGLLNGALWDVVSCEPRESTMEMSLVVADPDGQVPKIECTAWMHHVAGREEELRGNFARRELEEFDYGYALTCHKAQGSAWSSVYVLDESAQFGRDSQRWLYTAITRSARQLVLVR